MSTFDIWLWLKLDDIRYALGFSTFALFVVSLFVCAIKAEIGSSKWYRLPVFIASVAAISGISAVLIPSAKQAAAIYVTPKIVESRVFTNDIPELYGMAVDALKAKMVDGVEK